MGIDFDKFDKMINQDEFNEALRNIEENGGNNNYDVPDGTYAVVLERLALSENKNGEPMVKLAFVITEGQHSKLWLWNNYNIIYPKAMHDLNELLRQMEVKTKIEWTGSYKKYSEMLDDVLEEVENKVGFELVKTSTKKNGNTFTKFEITDSWDL